MAQSIRILKNSYRASVALMQLSAALLEVPGVEQASAIMATEGNLALLRETGLLGEGPIPGVAQPGPSDLLVIVRARSDAAAAAAQGKADALLASGPASSTGTTAASGPVAPRTLASALAASATAARRTFNLTPNLALVSVPGEYAAAEATKALKSGLNVMLFSDNVALADEVAMKRLAADKKLLLMGPDCGTAIIDGVPLGFANRVRRGAVGCIAASGTGLQQVTSLVDRLGAGISQAIGTGGRDLNAAVGGITMLEALSRLGRDADTRVIVLISKPPAPEVAKKVLAAAQRLRKPVVVNFIGADAKAISGDNLFAAHTLEDAARMAVALSRGKRPVASAARPAHKLPKPGPGQHWIRGLFSGGTFCYEAAMLMDEAQATGAFGAGGPSQVNCIWSNASVRAEGELDDPWSSREHTLVDLGDDTFTRGRPHPMIDQRLRNERLLTEAADPQVAVILFDVVLGDGSHPDPAGAMLPAIERARSMAAKKGRKLALVASVCGTAADTQLLDRQESVLAKAGVLLASSNAEAVRMAIDIVRVAKPKASTKAAPSSKSKTSAKPKKKAPATSPRRGVKKEKA